MRKSCFQVVKVRKVIYALRSLEITYCETSKYKLVLLSMFVIQKVIQFFPFSSEWISSLSNEVIHSFHRAAEIGVELKEPWLVCNAAVYLWNYTTHLLSQGRHKEVISIYSPVLDAVKSTGHAG